MYASFTLPTSTFIHICLLTIPLFLVFECRDLLEESCIGYLAQVLWQFVGERGPHMLLYNFDRSGLQGFREHFALLYRAWTGLGLAGVLSCGDWVSFI